MSNEFYYDYKNLAEATARQYLLGGKDNLRRLSKAARNIHYIKEIVGLKISLFTYDNIENAIPNINSQILEELLLTTQNLCLYFIPGIQQWVVCRYISCSERNYYNRPTYVNLESVNGYQLSQNVPYDDLIFVRDNRLDIPPMLCIAEYLEKIIKIEGRFERVLKNSTLPLVMVGDKKVAQSLKAIADVANDEEKSFIAGSDTLVDAVKGFAIDMNVTPEDVYNLKMKYRNECLASLGIYALMEKSERLLTREITSMNEYADFQYQQALICREEFVNKFNKLSPIKISLIETYDKNYLENSVLAAKETELIAEAGGNKNASNNPSTPN